MNSREMEKKKKKQGKGMQGEKKQKPLMKKGHRQVIA